MIAGHDHNSVAALGHPTVGARFSARVGTPHGHRTIIGAHGRTTHGRP